MLEKVKKYKNQIITEILILIVCILCGKAAYDQYIQGLNLMLMMNLIITSIVFFFIAKSDKVKNILKAVYLILSVGLIQMFSTDYYVLERLSIDIQNFGIIKLIPFIYIVGIFALSIITIKFIFGRKKQIGEYIAVITLSIIGLINIILLNVRGEVFRYADFANIKTASGFFGQYKIEYNHKMLYIILLTIISIIMLKILNNEQQKHLLNKKEQKEVAKNLEKEKNTNKTILSDNKKYCIKLLVILIIWLIVILAPIEKIFQAKAEYWDSGYIYLSNLFLEFKESKVEKPQNYEDILNEIKEKYESDSIENIESKPDIVVIMNESFIDLRQYQNNGNIEFQNQLNEIYSKLDEIYTESVYGTTYASVYGGGTANSEFEFLSSTSSVFRNDIVYSTKFKNTIDGVTQKGTMPNVLEKIGYYTTAMHINGPDAWDRGRVYDYFGIDNLMFYDDMVIPKEEKVGFTADKVTYDNILLQLEKQENNQPQFIFDVTIKNHGAYTRQNHPTTDALEVSGYDGDNEIPGTYMKLVQNSVNEIYALLEEIEKRERDTIVVFFGDHSPRLNDEFNQWLTGKSYSLTDDTFYQTPFFIWSNFDKKSENKGKMSINYLQNQVYEYLNMPKTGYQKFLEDIYEEYPVITSNFAIDKNGKYINPNDILKHSDWITKYSALSYNFIEENGLDVEKIYSLSD